MPKERDARPIMDVVKMLIPEIVVIVTSLIAFAGSVYLDRLVEPKLKCDILSLEQDR